MVTRERNRLTHLLGHALTPTVATQLDALLEADEHVYRISALKREAKDFSYKELRQEVARRQFFHPLYAFAHTFLATADLSNESSKYYASLVKFYTVYKLQRMARATTRLYLLCFAYYRFRQINDNLIEAFIHLVDQYEKQAKQAAEDAMQRACHRGGRAPASGWPGAQLVRRCLDTAVMCHSPSCSSKPSRSSIQHAFRWSPTTCATLRSTRSAVSGPSYTTLSPTFKRNLRHLFAELDFAGRVEDAPLLEAVACLQGLRRRGQSPRQTNPSGLSDDGHPEKRAALSLHQGSRESASLRRGSIRILGVSPGTQRAGGGQCLCAGEHRVPSLRGRLDQRRTVAGQRGGVTRDRCPAFAGTDSGHVAGVPRTPGCQVHRRQSAHR